MTSAASVHFHAPAGHIIGRHDGAVLRATGIRYARAVRFQLPVAELPATAPIQATSPAPACPQVADSLLAPALGSLFAGMTYDEDCLRLSVTRPAEQYPDEQLPVIVWVHGGSYVTGAGDLAVYDPGTLVAEQRVVFVAVTYRLGLLGFLGQEGGTPPNLGLLDLLEALRWVQRNISAFGGHPEMVTMFGQSAGADAIAHLMVAEGAQGLFKRVILHSAPLGLSRNRRAMSQAMAQAAGTFGPTATIDEVLARESTVTQAARRFGLKSGMPFGTQYGAHPLPHEADMDTSWRAAASRVDVLIGATAEETRFFAVLDPKYRRLLSLPLVGRLLSRPLVAISSRLVYLKATKAFARRHAQAGGRAYHFSVLFRPPGSEFGAAHTIDLPLLLGTQASWSFAPILGRATWEQVQEAGRQVRQLWADFARTGVLPSQVEIPGVLRLRQVKE
ncbi:carboxylesterase family protein [Hymenobacter cellulosivorans]|uniref:Carboxylesterase family protein n=1 Tax=Hymenobacter cellulosivorans TaxID=2932249 RepID=A0ABY4F8U8_9BACT|nr:carboxylesterase family protein [Hymenobacter cellulosivorans]UOQ53094.1 carboxylesterase family protein [Hymenobacter cellulosivorans]